MRLLPFHKTQRRVLSERELNLPVPRTGMVTFSHYYQIWRAVWVNNPTACTPVHMNMNTEPLSSALTGAFIPVEVVHGAAS